MNLVFKTLRIFILFSHLRYKMSTKTYQDIAKEIELAPYSKNSGHKKTILLGNGFSIGYRDNFFNNDELIKMIKEEIKHITLNNILDKERNLEYILKIMLDSTECIPIINKSYLSIDNIEEPLTELKKDRELLKNSLINVFEKNHPAYNGSEKLIETCAKNLTIYNQIFTLNYDLILYWCFLKCNDFPKEAHLKNNHFRDGFTREKNLSGNSLKDKYLLMWTPGNSRFNVVYLHGAIHLLRRNIESKEKISNEEEGSIYKIKKNKKVLHLKEVIKRLRDYLLYDNVIVLEGTSEKKMELIINNPYLSRGIDKLSRSSGHFVIYGCSIVGHNNKINNDSHIWARIINADIEKLYIGIHKKEFSEEKKKIILAALKTLYHKKGDVSLEEKIIFFLIENNDIWQSCNYGD